MFFFFWLLLVILIVHWSLKSSAQTNEDLGSSLLTPTTEKAVAVWATGFENPVFVYHGLDATINCSNQTTKKDPNKIPVWLDDRIKRLDSIRLRPRPSGRVLQVTDVQLEDSGRYACRFDIPEDKINITYWHHLIVYRMPVMTMEISLGYVTPTCREDRLKQRMDDFLPHFAEWPAQRDEYRISRYSCLPLSRPNGKRQEALFNFVVTHNLNKDSTDGLSICNVECMKVTFLNLLMSNLTLDLAERWKKTEKLNSTNYLYPEFRFDESLFKYKVISDCDLGYELFKEIICLPCRPGNFHDQKTKTCSLCPVNFFQTRFAALQCNPCPLNGTTEVTGTSTPATCTPLNPVLRTISAPYVIFIVFITLIILIAIVIICFMKRKRIKQFCKEFVMQKAEKSEKPSRAPSEKSLAGEPLPLTSTDEFPSAKRKRSAKYYEFRRKRGIIRMTSHESLTSFVLKRRVGKTTASQDPKKIVKKMKIPDKPGLMNMHFEKYQPLTVAASDDGLKSVRNSDVALADGTDAGSGIGDHRRRPLKYPLPWSGFAAPGETAPTPAAVPPGKALEKAAVLSRGKIATVPDDPIIKNLTPSTIALMKEAAAAKLLVKHLKKPKNLADFQTVLTAGPVSKHQIAALQRTLSTQIQKQKSTANLPVTKTATASQHQIAFQPTPSTPMQTQKSFANLSETIKASASQNKSAFRLITSTPIQDQKPTAKLPESKKATVLQPQSAFQPPTLTPIQDQKSAAKPPESKKATALKPQSAFQPPTSTPIQNQKSTAKPPESTKATVLQPQSALQPPPSTPIQEQKSAAKPPESKKATDSKQKSALQPPISTPIQNQKSTAKPPESTKATVLKPQSALQPPTLTPIEDQKSTAKPSEPTKATALKPQSAFQPLTSTPIQDQTSTAKPPESTKATVLQPQSAFQPPRLL